MATTSSLTVILLAGLLAGLGHASILTPPVLPLIVRNPYLSTWLQNARDVPWSAWPIFWTGQPVGMSMMASVPATSDVYPLLGKPHDFLEPEGQGYQIAFPLYLGAQYDATTTNLSYHIPNPSSGGKPAELTVSFLSPITPTSSLRQSIPASYISVYVEGDFDIDFYMDLNGDWVSGDGNSMIRWYLQSVEFDENGALWSWQVQKEADQEFAEFADRAEWGRLHFTGPTDANYESGSCGAVRGSFAKNSKLANNVEPSFRRIHENEPVFAFHKAFKLSSSQSNSSNVLFTVSHIQDEVVQFASERGLTYMRPLWKSWFYSEYSAIMFHYLDHPNAVRMAANYSEQLANDAYESGGQDYVDIVSLAARQVLGATSFAGTPEKPLIFLKEISSNGNTQTVDVIFPAFPFFIYTNPRWLAYLLEPLLEHQLSGQYPNKYSMHDLGAHFPNLTGHFDGNDEYMPVEECGDMLILGLALVNSLRYSVADKAGSIWSALGAASPVSATRDGKTPFPIVISEANSDGELFGLDDQWGGGARGEVQAEKWLQKSYPIWKQWTEYLIHESLEPGNQLCTDDFAGWLPLQSNLALKGIIGIKAMSELARTAGAHGDVAYYKNISDTYATAWQHHGMTRDGSHAKLAYHWFGSWTTLYSLFADAVLCFHPSASLSSSRSQNQPQRHPHQKPLPSPPPSDDLQQSADFLPTDLYTNQSAHYALALQRYGLPLDSRHLYSKADWLMQVAAVSPPSLRATLTHKLANWLNETETDLPFADLFDTEGGGGFGDGIRFTARPVVGSVFARLVLEGGCGRVGWELGE